MLRVQSTFIPFGPWMGFLNLASVSGGTGLEAEHLLRSKGKSWFREQAYDPSSSLLILEGSWSGESLSDTTTMPSFEVFIPEPPVLQLPKGVPHS